MHINTTLVSKYFNKLHTIVGITAVVQFLIEVFPVVCSTAACVNRKCIKRV